MFKAHVLVPVCRSAETLTALRTRERLLSSVSQHVNLQVRLCLKRFATRITLKGANTRVLQHVVSQVVCRLKGRPTFLTAEIPFVAVRF